MPFRISEFMKRGRSGNPWVDADDSAGQAMPSTHNSYDFRPSQPVRYPPPPPVPAEPQCSVFFDNGTGRIDPNLAIEQGLPPSVQTTDELAEYIKARTHERSYAYSRPQTSASQYLYRPDSHATSLHRSDSGHGSFAYEPPRSRAYTNSRANALPSVAGLRNKYATKPIARVLPGTTRKHKYEGFWLARGTMRKTEADLDNRKKWKKAKDARPPTASSGTYVETSGWYDSD